MEVGRRTLAVDVSTLVLGAVQTIHLAVGAVRAGVHAEAVLGAVVVVQGRRARPTDRSAPADSLEPVSVEVVALQGTGEAVHPLIAVLLWGNLSTLCPFIHRHVSLLTSSSPDWMELKPNGLLSMPEDMRDSDGLSSLSSLSWRDICALRMPLMLCGSPERGVPGAFASCPAELGMPGRGVAGTDRADVMDESVSPRLRGDPRREDRPCARPWETCCRRGVVVPETVPLALTPVRSPRPAARAMVGFVTLRRSGRLTPSGMRPPPLN